MSTSASPSTPSDLILCCNDDLVFGERKRSLSFDVSHESHIQESNIGGDDDDDDEDEEEILFALAHDQHDTDEDQNDDDANGGKKRAADPSREADSRKRLKVHASLEKESSPTQAALLPIHPIPIGNYPPPYVNRNVTGSMMMTFQQQLQQPMMMMLPQQQQQYAMPSFFPPPAPFQAYPLAHPHPMMIPETPLYTTIPRHLPPPPLQPQHVTSVALPCDAHELSAYQCLLRQQLEFFEATPWELHAKQQGRRKHLAVGQTGLRCRHCAGIPPRVRGAVYFPAALDGIYQAAQNMAAAHFLVAACCTMMPPALQHELYTLRGHHQRGSAACGGKRYWADGARALGIYETEQGLRWKDRDG